ncbi:hypothetical protein CMV_017503 [Castanea mollissima]|uniref:Uncharacterized protein n=1 Tax=Castanea mollissima TaxID=60419 RepID=A0A8J4VIJ8_9ROSI|nr:hypothetical protein CMV_017503 [Castanea mollissima]
MGLMASPSLSSLLHYQFSTWLSQTLSLTSLFGILVHSSTILKLILQIQTLATSNAIAHSPLRLQCLATAAAVHSSLRSYRQFRHGEEKRNSPSTAASSPPFDHYCLLKISQLRSELSQILCPSSEPQTNEGGHQASNSIIIEYPNSELETLYARYRAQRFKHKQMVDKWMEGDWGETSLANKENKIKSKIFSTTGSIPMAKYRYEMYLKTSSEPSPIDCFKKFHTKKDGKEWATDHAKTLYEKMDAIKAKAVSEGIKAKDVYGLTSSGKGCSKRCREDFTKEKEDLEA